MVGSATFTDEAKKGVIKEAMQAMTSTIRLSFIGSLCKERRPIIKPSQVLKAGGQLNLT
jgi:hypothetical protein